MREAVDGADILDQDILDVVGLHFGFEGGDILGRDVRIVGAMEREDFGLDVLAVGRGRGVQTSVEADDAFDGGAGAGEFDHGRAAEAVAGCGDLRGVGPAVVAEDVERGVDARTQQRAVGLVLAGFLTGGRRLRADSLAVDVGDQDVVAEGGELAGGFLLVVADAGPLVHDEHAGSLAGHGVVVGLPAFADDLAGLIFEGLLDDGRGERGERTEDGEQGRQEGFHAAQPSRRFRRRKRHPDLGQAALGRRREVHEGLGDATGGFGQGPGLLDGL